MPHHLTLPLICAIALMSLLGVDSLRAQNNQALNQRAQAVLSGFIEKAKAGGSANDAFLKLEGVRGSATDGTFKDQIPVLFTRNSVTWDSDGAQKTFYYVAIPVDQSYPILEQAVASGKSFPSARIAFRRAVGGQQTGYSEDVLQGVKISYFMRTSTPVTTYPEIVIIGLSFTSADWSYGAVKAGYDFEANKNR